MLKLLQGKKYQMLKHLAHLCCDKHRGKEKRKISQGRRSESPEAKKRATRRKSAKAAVSKIPGPQKKADASD